MTLSDDTQLRLVNDMSAVKDMFKWYESLKGDEILGLDTETSGLKIYSKDFRLRMVQIGDSENGWAVPYHLWGGPVMEIMRDWDTRDGKWTLHNMSYDYKVLKVCADYEIPWKNAHDTMIMARILFPDKPAGLKTLTDQFVDPRASSGDAALKKTFKDNGWDWDTIPVDNPDYWFYSALDPILASSLWHVLMPMIDREGVSGVYDLEMGALRVLVGAEHRGMRIDLDYVKGKYAEFEKKVEDQEAYIEERWGFNLNSNPQMVDKFTELGAKFSRHTPGGAPSVDKVQLDAFAHSDTPEVAELATLITETRKIAKMNGSYFKNFIEMEQESILHPDIQTMAARTGRMSIRNPALQTLHSNDSVIRNSFLPRNDGEILVSCDYSQVEARLLAHLSNDSNLISTFKEADRTGGDFFVSVGRLVYSDPNFQKSDPRRKLMKGIIYGASYGAGIPKMAETAGVSVEEMTVAANKLFDTFPGIKAYMSTVEQMGTETEQATGTGYITLESGRRLVADEGRMYSLTNYSIQGLAAELLKVAIMRIDSAGLSQYIQVPVHDELIFSLPEEDVEERFFPLIQECMSFTDGEYAVDLLAEPEIVGHRWGEKYGD